MKKMLKGLAGFAMMLVLVVGIVGTVFAYTSKSHGVEITSDTEFDIVEEKTGNWTPLTEDEAAKLINAAGGSVQASELKILWQYEIFADGTNIQLTFKADGVKAPQKLYAFHNNWDAENVWSLVAPTAGVEGNTITATFPHLSPVALVVYTPSGAGGDETSPKTGEANALLFIALAAIALGSVTAVVVAKKKA